MKVYGSNYSFSSYRPFSKAEVSLSSPKLPLILDVYLLRMGAILSDSSRRDVSKM